MDWPVLEGFIVFVSYLLVGLGFLWVLFVEPMLRFRANWLALKSQQPGLKFHAESHVDSLLQAQRSQASFENRFKSHGVPPLDV